MAVTFGEVYSKWKAGDPAAQLMAAANRGNDSTDALAWYDSEFRRAGMSNDVAGAATLRHLFVLLIGLGMRESSGRYCEGRDRSANNVTADTAEAGLFQMSWDARGASPELPRLFAAYSAHPQGFLSVFQDGVKPTDSDLSNYGTGQGAEFQRLCKTCPAFAAEAAALGLRTIRKHWGPINRREAEIRPECDRLLQQVQNLIDASATVPPVVPPPLLPVEPPTMDYTAQYQADAAALTAQVQALTADVRSMQAALDQLKTAIPASTPSIPVPTQLPVSPPPLLRPRDPHTYVSARTHHCRRRCSGANPPVPALAGSGAIKRRRHSVPHRQGARRAGFGRPQDAACHPGLRGNVDHAGLRRGRHCDRRQGNHDRASAHRVDRGLWRPRADGQGRSRGQRIERWQRQRRNLYDREPGSNNSRA